jgi:hypothetical protein
MGPGIGTAMRFVSTPTVETPSKVAATMGAVETWAVGTWAVETWAAREAEIRLEAAWGGSSNDRSNVLSTSEFNGSLSEKDAEDGGDGELKSGAGDEERIVGQDRGEHSGSFPRTAFSRAAGVNV